MPPKSLIIIDGTRLTEERAKLARGTGAPALAAICAVSLFSIAIVIIALAFTTPLAGV